MEKRRIKSAPVAVAALTVMLALFLGAGIAAAIPQPTPTCTLVNSAGEPIGATVVATEPYTEGGKTIWKYTISGLATKGTQFAILVPACDSIPSIGYTGNNYSAIPGETFQLYSAPATGLSSNWNGFGVWDVYNDLVTVTSIGSTTFGFGTDNAVPIPTDWGVPMQFKSGNAYYYCRNIKGPGCAEPPPPRAQGVVTSLTRYSGVSPGGVEYDFCTVTDPATQCQQVLKDCSNPAAGVIGPGDPKYVPFGSLTFSQGVLADISVPGQDCPSVVISDDNSAGSTYYCNPRTGVCIRLN